jgi:acetyl/propionyl-CoA carboxylase alpha subunit
MIGWAAFSIQDAYKIDAMFGKTREEAVVLAKKALHQKKIKPKQTSINFLRLLTKWTTFEPLKYSTAY